MSVLVPVCGGLLFGMAAYAFHYANGSAYLSEDPRACINCHIMQPQYDSWQKSSHHTVANCVGCHLPHDLAPKYMAKAIHGWNHSKGFTLQDFPEPIRMSDYSTRILGDNCIRCHSEFHRDLALASPTDMQCTHCHRSVGHGPRAGLGGRLLKEELAPLSTGFGATKDT